MWPFGGEKEGSAPAGAKTAFDRAVEAANSSGMGMEGTFGQATGHWGGKEILIQKRDNNFAEISVIPGENSPLFERTDEFVRANWKGKVESDRAEGYVSIIASEDGVEGALGVIKKAAEIK